jgi:hypothetical protein
MSKINLRKINLEIDSMLSKIKHDMTLKEGIPSKDAEDKANEVLLNLLEDALDKYTSDLANGKENGIYLVSHESLDMFAKATIEEIADIDDLWK